MTYETLRAIQEIIDEVLTLEEDKRDLLDFQSKLVDVDTKVAVSFSFENPQQEQQDEVTINYDSASISILSSMFESSSTVGKLVPNSEVVTFVQSELTSRACIAMISSVIRYNDLLIKDRIEDIKKLQDEGTADTVKKNKTA